MTESYDVLSAFLDDEAFDPAVLAEALTSPEARQLLIDMAVMRRLVQAQDGVRSRTPQPPVQSVSRRVLVMGAAAALIAFAGGYVAGWRSLEPSARPPAPTLTMEAAAGWETVPGGDVR
jgi:hypothetical protein